jgi:hypothetical protein
MKVEQVDRILEGLVGVKRDGQAYVVAEDGDLAAYVAFPAEVLTIGRVVRVEKSGDLMILDTASGDRYHVVTQDIAMFKVSAAAKKGVAGRGPTGFR